jgi:hypothetical protein
MEASMSQPTFRGRPITRRKPELVRVRVIPWDEQKGLYGLLCEFDDGETFGEVWGTKEETEIAAAIRKQDIQSLPLRPVVR